LSLSILISDPDSIWVNKLKTFFLEKLFLVDSADEGKSSQLLIYKNKYQVVVLDMDIVNHSSLEVLRYIKLNAPEIQVIFTMSNMAKLKQMEITESDLKKIGASYVFVKPLRPEKIFETIESEYKIHYWKDIVNKGEITDEEEVKAKDDDFTRIKFENFFSGSTTIYDHYIRLGQNSFVKILHKGEAFDSCRLKKYSSNNLEYLYFKTSDRAIYINFTTQLLSRIIGTGSSTVEKKMNSTQSVVEKYLEEVFSSGLRPSLIEEGKLICENMYNLIQKEPELSNYMKTFEDYNPPAYAHLFLVSFFSIATCRNLEWANARTTEIVGMGALLHDIGKLKLPPYLRDKNMSLMNAKELELFQSHPKLGADMLKSFGSISESVKQIIYQHHEYSNGEGFPNKLNGSKIYPPAKIVSLNNMFVEFLIQEKVSPFKGIKLFIQDRQTLTKYDPLILKALVAGFMEGK
jgi:putative nucleotidyltransferase with HDIG domain